MSQKIARARFWAMVLDMHLYPEVPESTAMVKAFSEVTYGIERRFAKWELKENNPFLCSALFRVEVVLVGELEDASNGGRLACLPEGLDDEFDRVLGRHQKWQVAAMSWSLSRCVFVAGKKREEVCLELIRRFYPSTVLQKGTKARRPIWLILVLYLRGKRIR